MTWLIAIAGLALALYGLVVFSAFAIALRALARVQTSEAFTRAQNSGVVKSGDALAARAIDAIPIGFVRGMIKKRLAGGFGEAGVAFLQDNLQSSRSVGGWVGIGGLILFFASFWIGPRLSQAAGW